MTFAPFPKQGTHTKLEKWRFSLWKGNEETSHLLEGVVPLLAGYVWYSPPASKKGNRRKPLAQTMLIKVSLWQLFQNQQEFAIEAYHEVHKVVHLVVVRLFVCVSTFWIIR